MKNKLYTFGAFSIIEVLIGIFIFSLGLVSIYMLLESSLNINAYNKNAIIASNLAREQVELFRNIRDTNYKKFQAWNQLVPESAYNATHLFLTGSYYTLENDVSGGTFSTKVNDISLGFEEGKDKLTGASMMGYQLCLTAGGLYTYNCSSPNTRTPFYRYLFIKQTDGETGEIYTINSKVIWYHRGYHEYMIQSIISDWRRI